MSTLVAQTISNGTVSTSSANVIQGSAKAWVNFNGTGTPTINASYNVSSVTYTSTGIWVVNFTSALSNTNYVAALAPGGNSTNNNACTNIDTLATSSFRVLHFESNTAQNFTTAAAGVKVGVSVFST